MPGRTTQSMRELQQLNSVLARRTPRREVHGQKGGTVRVESSSVSQAIFVGGCEDATLELCGKAAQVTLQGCSGCSVALRGPVVSSLEIVGCRRCTVVMEEAVSSVLLDQTQQVRISFPGTNHAPGTTRIYTANCEDTFLQAARRTGAEEGQREERVERNETEESDEMGRARPEEPEQSGPLGSFYRIEADGAPVMGQRWRLRTVWDEELGAYATERCDLYGNVGSALVSGGVSTCSTREPTPSSTPRGGPAAGLEEEDMLPAGFPGCCTDTTCSRPMASIGEELDEEEKEEEEGLLMVD